MYTIKVWMKDGEVWETRRDTFKGMDTCLNHYIGRDDVKRIRVYKKPLKETA